MSTPLRVAAALVFVCSTASIARAQPAGGSGEEPHVPMTLLVSEAPPEAEPRHEPVWFWVGAPIFLGGAALGITALALDDDSASVAFGAISAIPLTIGVVLLMVGVVRWADIEAARARFHERRTATVAFDPTTLILRW